ncbi:hypothetical protein NC653_024341 [Populus alba x Populus x berolinensis]|uniref:Uncharacterized protein n=1 Tax=Populus alba x Populus x berolinensis TaxID=444605 RepID=A0AAD6M8K4_9ROSI|nr:hypothetical protein NC653_024341 [Populus alba x Populus x berolinensis]
MAFSGYKARERKATSKPREPEDELRDQKGIGKTPEQGNEKKHAGVRERERDREKEGETEKN